MVRIFNFKNIFMAKKEKKVQMQANKTYDMTEEEMRADLESGFEDVQSKNNALETSKITTDNEIKQLKTEIMTEMFKFLQNNGVDPNNLESINQFLATLEQQNPDFVTLFETLLNGVDPNGIQQAPQEQTPIEQTATTTPIDTTLTPGGATDTTTPVEGQTAPDLMTRLDGLRQRGIV